MARYRNLYQISKEDDEVSVDTETTVDVTDVIEDNDTNNELEADKQQLEADQASLEESTEIIEELDTQIEANNEKLEQPESVTEEDVAVAQEAYLYLMAKAGYPYKNINKISLENYSTPSEKLQHLNKQLEISREGFLEAWSKFKNIFSKNIDTYIKKKTAQLQDKVENVDKLIAKAKSFDGTLNTEGITEIVLNVLPALSIGNNFKYDPDEFCKYINRVLDNPVAQLIDIVYKDKSLNAIKKTNKGIGDGFAQMLYEEVQEEIQKHYTTNNINKNVLNLVQRRVGENGSILSWGIDETTQVCAVLVVAGKRGYYICSDHVSIESFFSILNKIIGGLAMANRNYGSAVNSNVIGSAYENIVKCFSIQYVNVRPIKKEKEQIQHNIKSKEDIIKHLNAVKNVLNNCDKLFETIKKSYYTSINEIDKKVEDTGASNPLGKVKTIARYLTKAAQNVMYAQADCIDSTTDGIIRVCNHTLS